MKASTAATAAAVLRTAHDSLTPCAVLEEELRPTSVDDAYAIQDAGVAAWSESVAVLKAGITAQAGLDKFGLSAPIAGQIGESGVHGNDGELSAALFCQAPILECEFALRVGPDGKPDAVAPAIEVLTFRYDMSTGPMGIDVVADNVGAAGVVLGDAHALADIGDLTTCSVTLFVNGEEKVSGTGAEIMDGPLASFARVMSHENARGREPSPGTWIITGSATGMTPIAFGDSFHADFGPLGALAASVGLRTD